MRQLDLQLLVGVQVNVAMGETEEVDLNHHKNATSLILSTHLMPHSSTFLS